jgi:hypothetical protein
MPSGAGIAFTLLSLLFAWALWQSRGSDAGDGEPRWRLRLRSLIRRSSSLPCCRAAARASGSTRCASSLAA